MKNEIVIYTLPDGRSNLNIKLQGETIWLSLNEISALFDRDKSVISRHLKNIFDNESGRRVSRKIEHLIQGYTINRSRIDKNYTEFLKAVEQVKALLPQDSQIKAEDIFELIKLGSMSF